MTDTDFEWDFESPFLFDVKVEADDIDGLNHTNNAVYVRWCEQVAWAHSESLGMSVENYQQLDRAMAIRHSEYDYIMATQLGDELLIGTWLTKSEKINMERRFQIVRPRDGVTVLRGCWQLVCIEISTGRPRRLPPEFVDAYGGAVVGQ